MPDKTIFVSNDLRDTTFPFEISCSKKVDIAVVGGGPASINTIFKNMVGDDARIHLPLDVYIHPDDTRFPKPKIMQSLKEVVTIDKEDDCDSSSLINISRIDLVDFTPRRKYDIVYAHHLIEKAPKFGYTVNDFVESLFEFNSLFFVIVEYSEHPDIWFDDIDEIADYKYHLKKLLDDILVVLPTPKKFDTFTAHHFTVKNYYREPSDEFSTFNNLTEFKKIM